MPRTPLRLLALFACAPRLFALDGLVWPTPNRAFVEGRPIAEFVQPTASGEVQSGLFGCVRTDGYQFHEGIDLKSIKRDLQGEPTDTIFAVLPGRVTYTSSKAGYSSYGRYIVVEHTEPGLVYQSLYAHLDSVDIDRGQTVAAGQRIAVMGHTASNGLPLERSHLHLEFNFRLSDNFEAWYKKQKFGSPNYHGAYNGFNFISWNPLEFYESNRAGKVASVAEYIRSRPTCVIAIVRTQAIPSFVRRNSALLASPIPEGGVAGWQVEFTQDGLPKLWTPLATPPKARLMLVDGVVPQAACRRLKAGNHRAGRDLRGILELLFGGRF